jgi:hypothetical protein
LTTRRFWLVCDLNMPRVPSIDQNKKRKERNRLAQKRHRDKLKQESQHKDKKIEELESKLKNITRAVERNCLEEIRYLLNHSENRASNSDLVVQDFGYTTPWIFPGPSELPLDWWPLDFASTPDIPLFGREMETAGYLTY